ncbi:hypothetical protein BV898_03701 [Hypsibius exemplaris]|uniref:Uncharacterized protein n=1 Tax=Hypsibius exemplaris TaxID=2072580 RepID=A0A1W0X4N2_HYPEX|nr:hypothetical protein BV898_03701 [Hypsibius exemplaris]
MENDPTGMTMTRSLPALWEPTVSDILVMSHVVGSTAEAGRTARTAAEGNKHRTCAELEGQYLFVPLAFETFGI